MDAGQMFSGLVTGIGLLGFWLAGAKVWWSWYVNVANQLLWVAFAVITGYYAFLIGTAFYLVVFSRNAYIWTKERREKSPSKQLEKVGEAVASGSVTVNEVRSRYEGVGEAKIHPFDNYTGRPLCWLKPDRNTGISITRAVTIGETTCRECLDIYLSHPANMILHGPRPLHEDD